MRVWAFGSVLAPVAHAVVWTLVLGGVGSGAEAKDVTPAAQAGAAPFTAINQNPGQGMFDRLAGEPWRYGGMSDDGRHRIVIGLRRAGEDGIGGEYVVLDQKARAVAYGAVQGRFSLPDAAGMSVSCQMTVPLPDRVLTLTGTCSRHSLSGSIESRKTPASLLSQVSSFVSPDMSVAQYWLTGHGFYEIISALSRN